MVFWLSLLLAPTGVQAAPHPGQQHPATQPAQLSHAPGRLMIQFTPEACQVPALSLVRERGKALPTARTGLAAVDQVLADLGATGLTTPYGQLKNQDSAEKLGLNRWFMVHLPVQIDVPAAAERLLSVPQVTNAVPDWQVHLTTVPVSPNDPAYGNNWGHHNTAQLPSYNWVAGTYTGTPVGMPGFDAKAPLAWGGDQGYGNSAVIIAILDTGVDLTHPDLRLVAGYDYGDNDSNPSDDSAAAGHGTLCAGVAAARADNSLGVAGAAGGCSVMPLKVADSQGNLYMSAIQSALHHAADNGAGVASMSFGFNMASDPPTDAALQYAHDAGVVLVAAVGNENAPNIIYPANSMLVIAVGAASPCGERKRSSSNPAELDTGVFADPNSYTCDGERWWGSNYSALSGPDLPDAVDVMGPANLPSTDITGAGGWDTTDYYANFSGTSCATPYVAGVCALLLSHQPGLPPDMVRDRIRMTALDMSDWLEATPGWDIYTGWGLVNAAAAVDVSAASADFSATPTSGCLPLQVTFTDASVSYANPLATWQWDFGDGGISNQQNPTWLYSQPGTYAVTLTVMAPDVMGYLWLDSKHVTNLVTVPAPVQAQFTASTYWGYPPLTIQFTDASVGNATAWFWDFGDGQTSTAQSPQHTYTAKGHFSVILTTTDLCGSDTTIPFDVFVGVPTGVDLPGAAFALRPNVPNPFNPATVLEFELEQEGWATLEVFDVAGHRVATLLDGVQPAGPQRVTWRPRQVQSGVYFARLVQGKRIAVERMVLIR
jgi:subtilisin family serine protease